MRSHVISFDPKEFFSHAINSVPELLLLLLIAWENQYHEIKWDHMRSHVVSFDPNVLSITIDYTCIIYTLGLKETT